LQHDSKVGKSISVHCRTRTVSFFRFNILECKKAMAKIEKIIRVLEQSEPIGKNVIVQVAVAKPGLLNLIYHSGCE
jgi:hypothetical protein